MNIQWYPGHMTKTRRQIEADLGLVDMVAEIIDARIPISSRNPDIDAICAAKPRLIVLNRADQADPTANQLWTKTFQAKGFAVLETDAKTGKGVDKFHLLPAAFARADPALDGLGAGWPSGAGQGGGGTQCGQVHLYQPGGKAQVRQSG